ncbi:ribulose-phosphate 3-epimerase [Christensenellaceae bacterium]|nr:ribulose-phosphate 3-epimerase [Christensenellaceae bacterium]BDF60644.1 ribulose-phosphate 3-epimerase [Christensenellaceae bacterium]
MKVSASLLACDYLKLEQEIDRIERAGADLLHLDIMDGHYVNNFAFSIDMVEKIKRVAGLPVEVHLEIDNPQEHIENFAKAGADIIIVQADCVHHPIRLLSKIRSLGKKAGYAVNPCEPAERIDEVFPYIDYLLMMSAEPGFGGQPFNGNCIRKIKYADDIRKANPQAAYSIGVDGGVTAENTADLREAGTDVIIVGSAIFCTDDYAGNIAKFK